MAFVPKTWAKGDRKRRMPFISEEEGWALEKAKRFKRFWKRYWFWRSVLKNSGKIMPEDIWGDVA